MLYEVITYKKIIAYINAENEMSSSILKKAADYEQNGADALFLYNYSKDENEREEFLLTVKHVIRRITSYNVCYTKLLRTRKLN